MVLSFLTFKLKLKVKRKLLKKVGKLKSLMHIGEGNLLIVQKSKNIQKWAHVLFNIKHKLYRTKRIDRNKLMLVMFSFKKDLVLYFEDSKNVEMVQALINSNKKEILLKELTLFSSKMNVLKNTLKNW